MTDLVSITKELSKGVDSLRFAPPVTHVLNPLDYAWAPHKAYLDKYGNGPKECVLLGMNPGPFGMAQTGVPFGEVTMVRDWLEIEEKVTRPAQEHPKRPIQGFDCPRKEVSGARLWGWIKERFGTPQSFFDHHFVMNYCPLVFMEESGRNRTPDKLKVKERNELFGVCDRALRDAVVHMQAKCVIGVGRFAQARAAAALEGLEGIHLTWVAHPSPANPAANAGWSKTADGAFDQALAEIVS